MFYDIIFITLLVYLLISYNLYKYLMFVCMSAPATRRFKDESEQDLSRTGVYVQ